MKRQNHPRINRLILGLGLSASLGLVPQAMAVITVDKTTAPSRVGAMVQAHEFSQAASLLQSQWQANPTDPSLGPQLLRLRQVLGQTEATEVMVESAKSTAPSSPNTWLLWAMGSYGLAVDQDDPNQESRALDGLNSVLAQIPKDQVLEPNALYIDGLAQLLNGNLQASEVALLKALHQSPNHTLALMALSDVYLTQQQPKLAVPLLQQLLELAPHDVDTLFLMGRLYFAKENPEQALKLLDASQQADTVVRPRRLLLQAECYRLLGKRENAIGAFEGVLKAWPQRADLWVKLGHLYDAQGDRTKGLKAFQTAYQLQPEVLNPFIEDALATLWHESPEKATPLLDRLPQIAPDRGDLVNLAVENHFWLFAEGILPTQSTLNDLTEAVESIPRPGVDLFLSDIQIEWMRNHALTEGLFKALVELDTTGSWSAHIQKALMLEQPLVARDTLGQLPADKLDEILITRSALWGLGSWAKHQVDTNTGEVHKLAPELQAWTQSQDKLYRAAWTNALLFSRAKQYPQALDAIGVMRHHEPLSLSAQFLRANIAANLEDMEPLDQALANILQMGPYSPKEAEELKRLEQIQAELHRREDALAKP